MATAIFNPNQVLLSAMAGANYAAPYLHQIEQKHPGQSAEILQEMLQVLSVQQYPMKLIVANVKNLDQIRQSAKWGAQAITLPPTIYNLFVEPSPFTVASIEKFDHSWARLSLAEADFISE